MYNYVHPKCKLIDALKHIYIAEMKLTLRIGTDGTYTSKQLIPGQ